MSIVVQNLVKIFGQQKALDDVSFAIQPGEIVGFLGPNGAGKSTTMKILTGYLPPTSGSVAVAGFDVVAKPQQVRQRIGYLPEHNPLYLDMYVHEFLNFIGGIYGLRGYALKERVEQMISLCGLSLEQNKRIESLSKGFRQRVGLAQALLHEPEVLILDEPTTGLDPNQIIEIRQLIKDVSKNKTVIFSTHIMQEVQALCTRAIIINSGTLVADESLDQLVQRKKGATTLIVEFETPVSIDDLKSTEGVRAVVEMEPGVYRISATEGLDVRPALFRFAADRQLSLRGLRQEVDSLETIFKELTQHSQPA
jgi:ABC-2 type transport system ATP-binding protein